MNKQLRVLLVSNLPGDTHNWQTELSIIEQFKHLTKEIATVKASQHLADAICNFNPDLLLVLGSDEVLSAENIEAVKALNARKAIWLCDEEAVFNEMLQHPYASLFDVLFTQNATYAGNYKRAGCKRVSHLPFAADRVVYFPMHVSEPYQSDVLIIGDAVPERFECIQEIRRLAETKKIYAIGSGWEEVENIEPIHPCDKPANYYNGADLIINFHPSQRKVFEIASCGAFQMVKEHPYLREYANPGEDIVTFAADFELRDKLHYYLDHIEQRRVIATKALWGSLYTYSHLQLVTKLLETAFL